METREYRTVDKSTWGDGPWMNEPDKKQWADKVTGLPCLIKRNDAGALCGYVGVAPGHPKFKVGYSSLDVDVHGGLTYSAFCDPAEDEAHGICHIPGPEEPDHVWWLGFDCHHGFDIGPAYEARRKFPSMPNAEYRDFDYVTKECTSLAAQLAAMK